jgi:hypothetical protein
MEEIEDVFEGDDEEALEDEILLPDARAIHREKRRARFARVREICPVVLIWARYFLPVATALALIVMGFFKTVRFAYRAPISLWRLVWNTLVSARDYLGGERQASKSWFYGILTGITLAELLLALAATFLVGLAAYTAIRAFVSGYKSERSNRAKLIFKIAFPGRKMLFFTNLLILLPLCYPYYFSFIGRRFLAIGGEDVIFVTHNSLFWGACVLCVLTLILALVIPRYERRKKMNMFLLNHAIESEPESENEEDADDAEESDEA